jgi:DNA-binding NtrC family response regulator
MGSASHPSILLVGNDAGLLWSRAALLEGLGATIEQATTAHEAIEFIEQEEIGVVVLCSSVTEKDGLEISAAVERQSNPAAILLINKFSGYDEARLPTRVDGFTDPEPAKFIASVRKLLFAKAPSPDSPAESVVEHWVRRSA